MFNNDKTLQLYSPKQLSGAIIQWLDQEVHEIYASTKKKINLSILSNDLFSQPFLPKFLLKVNYQFFSKTELVDFIDSTILRKLSPTERKSKFLNLIEKYLCFCEKRKFTEKYKTLVYNHKSDGDTCQPSHEVIKLLLFIAIRSQNKNEFIERIFSMPAQSQQNLMDEIMEVENILERITEKQELVLQFNSLKDINISMKSSYEELVDCQNKLLDQCEKQDFAKIALSEKNQYNREEKIKICESLGITDVQKPYLKIFKKAEDKNATLTRILVQKQKKENQLLEQHNSLKQRSDEFEEVLFELNGEKKKLKVFLNDKKNESFHLEMRASLRLSQEKQNLRKSEALKRKSLSRFRTALKNTKNIGILYPNTNDRFGTKSKQDHFSEINQSVSIMNKIEQLRSQKDSLRKELSNLKTQNQKLKEIDISDNQIFSQLESIYSQVIALCPEYANPKRKLPKQIINTILETPYSLL